MSQKHLFFYTPWKLIGEYIGRRYSRWTLRVRKGTCDVPIRSLGRQVRELRPRSAKGAPPNNRSLTTKDLSNRLPPLLHLTQQLNDYVEQSGLEWQMARLLYNQCVAGRYNVRLRAPSIGSTIAKRIGERLATSVIRTDPSCRRMVDTKRTRRCQSSTLKWECRYACLKTVRRLENDVVPIDGTNDVVLERLGAEVTNLRENP